MKELYLLDKDLYRKYTIDTFSSVIWAKRYNEIGDCEIVIPATENNVKKINECRYISREDDEMVCEIEKKETKTDVENGDSMIVTGKDVKNILNRRIVEKQTNFNGLVEDYIRTLINDSIISPTNIKRKISNFILEDKQNFTETIKEQVTYSNVGEKTQELCKQLGWGRKVTVSDRNFVFSLLKGNDLSDYVTFSQNHDNILTTDYLEDNSNIKNVALIAGEGEGTERTTTIIGSGEGLDRHELYVDARDVSKTIDYDELISSYPNGELKTVNEITYYEVDGVNIAIITYNENDEISNCTLCDDIYEESLKNVGCEKMAGYTSISSFSGEIITGISYTYKEDYDLGDIVSFENKYGITSKVRITEVIESCDANGDNIEPKFENVE